jgi:hypothetical protein
VAIKIAGGRLIVATPPIHSPNASGAPNNLNFRIPGGLRGKQEVIRSERKTGLPTLDGDNWRNQDSTASQFFGEVTKSSWLRIQSVNRMFGLTLGTVTGMIPLSSRASRVIKSF